jgi:cytidylate kinase
MNTVKSSKRIPVIAIDGPTASGKGTVAQLVADRLGFHYLDSGALYRLAAFSALRENISPTDEAAVARLAARMPCRFVGGKVLLAEEDVSDAIRTEHAGNMASRIAAMPSVRQALTSLQLSFRREPGLVADGRDMGTVIFPDADLKVYLTASVDTRANRRHKQLIDKGFSANIIDLRRDLEERDQRDSQRAAAPLKPADDACLLDTSDIGIEAAVQRVLEWYRAKMA